MSKRGNKLKKQRVIRGLAGIFSKRKRKKKRAGGRGRRSIVFRAVVFLSDPLFKGTLALMALPYAALGVRAGARHCAVPAELELQGLGIMTARTGLSRQLQRGTLGEPADMQHADGLPADDRETERLLLHWTECVFKMS